MIHSVGIIYAAEGQDYLDLARQSALTTRHHNPDCPMVLFTDQKCEDPVFDEVRPLPFGCRRSKIAAMIHAPFERTVFLDSDTLVLRPLTDMFDVLDRFELALCHDVRRSSALIRTTGPSEKPDLFCQHNSGVMAFRKSPRVEGFLRQWAALYDSLGEARDQISLAECLWSSDIRFWVLPEEWNLRRTTIMDAWEPLDAVPAVIHSHQLVRHLRGGGPQITTVDQIIELERSALKAEWDQAQSTVPDLDALSLPERFATIRKREPR